MLCTLGWGICIKVLLNVETNTNTCDYSLILVVFPGTMQLLIVYFSAQKINQLRIKLKIMLRNTIT